MLNPSLLQAFCEGFYGYGAADARHWFISMEEGGGTSEQEIQAYVGSGLGIKQGIGNHGVRSCNQTNPQLYSPMARPLRIEFPGGLYHVTSREAWGQVSIPLA